jgi:hypothetical protein
MNFSRRRVKKKLFISLVVKFTLDNVVLEVLLNLVIGLIADELSKTDKHFILSRKHRSKLKLVPNSRKESLTSYSKLYPFRILNCDASNTHAIHATRFVLPLADR